jgi:hypothetical protein
MGVLAFLAGILGKLLGIGGMLFALGVVALAVLFGRGAMGFGGIFVLFGSLVMRVSRHEITPVDVLGYDWQRCVTSMVPRAWLFEFHFHEC